MVEPSQSITEVLANYVAQTGFEDLPPEEVAAARESLLETMGVAIGAAGAPGTDQTLRLVRRDGATGKSTIWLTSGRCGPARAAFTNSVHSAALDFDSLHHLAVAHSDIVIVPAAVAVAEDQAASGQELLTAIALGNDVLCRFALATRGEYRGWFFTSIYGAIAAAAITAKLLKGDAATIANAMGLAYMNSAGTFQAIEERSMAKRALAAFAAQSGVHCGYLAAEGFDGPRQVVEGKFGLYNVYQRGNASVIVEELGSRFEGSRISRKPFPTCQCNQAAVEAALDIVNTHDLQVDDIAGIETITSAYNNRIVGAAFDPRHNPQVAAQFSIQYSVACALMRRKLGIAEIQDAVILHPELGRLASRVRVTVDPENRNTYAPSEVVVTLKSGRTVSRKVDVLRGTPEAPLSVDDMTAKIANCIAAAGREAPEAKARAAMAALSALEKQANAADAIAAFEKATGATG